MNIFTVTKAKTEGNESNLRQILGKGKVPYKREGGMFTNEIAQEPKELERRRYLNKVGNSIMYPRGSEKDNPKKNYRTINPFVQFDSRIEINNYSYSGCINRKTHETGRASLRKKRESIGTRP